MLSGFVFQLELWSSNALLVYSQTEYAFGSWHSSGINKEILYNVGLLHKFAIF